MITRSIIIVNKSCRITVIKTTGKASVVVDSNISTKYDCFPVLFFYS